MIERSGYRTKTENNSVEQANNKELLDKDTFTLAKKYNIDINENLANFLAELKKPLMARLPEETRKKFFASLMGGELVTVPVQMFSPFANFLKEYMGFFGVKDSMEEFCRKLIYDRICFLHDELSGFVDQKAHFIDDKAWYFKHDHVAACAYGEKAEQQENEE